jgi:hypothetical protein
MTFLESLLTGKGFVDTLGPSRQTRWVTLYCHAKSLDGLSLMLRHAARQIVRPTDVKSAVPTTCEHVMEYVVI